MYLIELLTDFNKSESFLDLQFLRQDSEDLERWQQAVCTHVLRSLGPGEGVKTEEGNLSFHKTSLSLFSLFLSDHKDQGIVFLFFITVISGSITIFLCSVSYCVLYSN